MQTGDQLLQLFDDHLEVIVNPCDYVCDYAQAIGGVVTTKKLIFAKYSRNEILENLLFMIQGRNSCLWIPNDGHSPTEKGLH